MSEVIGMAWLLDLEQLEHLKMLVVASGLLSRRASAAGRREYLDDESERRKFWRGIEWVIDAAGCPPEHEFKGEAGVAQLGLTGDLLRGGGDDHAGKDVLPTPA